ncbi:hypothetical protein HOY80DRAFT_1085705 [Tuber brumale]|nr:hypothetical protein HOY80DRAFT_1085705 [Tuber brumale]
MEKHRGLSRRDKDAQTPDHHSQTYYGPGSDSEYFYASGNPPVIPNLTSGLPLYPRSSSVSLPYALDNSNPTTSPESLGDQTNFPMPNPAPGLPFDPRNHLTRSSHHSLPFSPTASTVSPRNLTNSPHQPMPAHNPNPPRNSRSHYSPQSSLSSDPTISIKSPGSNQSSQYILAELVNPVPLRIRETCPQSCESPQDAKAFSEGPSSVAVVCSEKYRILYDLRGGYDAIKKAIKKQLDLANMEYIGLFFIHPLASSKARSRELKALDEGVGEGLSLISEYAGQFVLITYLKQAGLKASECRATKYTI